MGNPVESWEFKWMITLIVMAFAGVSLCALDTQSPTKGNSITTQKPLEVKRTEPSKRHAVKSIKSEDGDIIDCIDLYRQPAFLHPALRNHTVQLEPSNEKTMVTTAKSTVIALSQLWRKSGSCPKGTIPIRRIQNKVLTMSDGNSYGRKKGHFPRVGQISDGGKSYFQQVNHSIAILLTAGYSYSGAKGDIRVWNPYVEYDDEYSTSQICLKSGPYYNYESIESGWAVNPSVYGDRKTRLFVYWTVSFHEPSVSWMMKLQLLGDYIEDPEFYFGGPGRNYKCP